MVWIDNIVCAHHISRSIVGRKRGNVLRCARRDGSNGCESRRVSRKSETKGGRNHDVERLTNQQPVRHRMFMGGFSDDGNTIRAGSCT